MLHGEPENDALRDGFALEAAGKADTLVPAQRVDATRR